MGEYTKGPWTVEDFRQVKEEAPHWSQPTYANGGFLVFSDACEHHPVADCSANHTCRDEEECEANARLIAAAPDMLEALKITARGLEGEFGPRVAEVNFPALYAAISKAQTPPHSVKE